ncbi:hypothetical protein TIFTF001_013920 [Ficus carica]|uniref:Uncharacterized protein n=1 Tax=Ficus carica TaxID=3494 RepID=A0AA88AQK1_FICCA|nr:hypothetical protein TIFTF001_013920 [Ficus carica]
MAEPNMHTTAIRSQVHRRSSRSQLITRVTCVVAGQTGLTPKLSKRLTIPGASSSLGSRLKCLSSAQLPSEYQSWINRVHINHNNMYANQIVMQQAISELLPNLIFAPVVPPDDLVPLGPSTNPLTRRPTIMPLTMTTRLQI